MHRVSELLEISPSYLFRLFGTKQLFLFACIDVLVDELARPGSDTEEPIDATADDLHSLLSAITKDTVLALFCLQVLAEASRNRDVAKKCQSAFARLAGSWPPNGLDHPMLMPIIAEAAIALVSDAVKAGAGATTVSTRH